MFVRIRSVFGLITLLLLGTVQGFATVVPQIVLGGGYDFVIIVANKTNSVRRVEFILLEGYGEPWSAPFSVNGEPHGGNRVRVTLTAHSVEKLRLIGGEYPHVGYLSYEEDFQFGNFMTPLVIQLFYEFRQRGELIDSIGAPAGLATFGSNALAFPVQRSATLNTGLALAPWSPPGFPQKGFRYTLRLFDEDGNQVGLETFTFEGHEARFFDEFFPNVPREFLGWISLEVSAAMFEHLCVTVLRQELTSTGFQLTHIQPDFGAPWQLF